MYSRERCWLNVKFAFAALNIIALLFCTSSQPMEGFYYAWFWVIPEFCLCSLALQDYFLEVPDGEFVVPGWGGRACRELVDGKKTQSSLTLLLSDRVCGCMVRLWITKGIVDSFTQGTIFWAGAGGTNGTKRIKIGLLCTQMSVIKSSWVPSEILSLLGH